jgi:carbonic anhydrase/acetyltransferase-like protein (isoleucine patch superfamily)
MLYVHDRKQPRIDPTSRVAPNATVCGDVTIGPNCSIGFGGVHALTAGRTVNVQLRVRVRPSL